METDDSRSSTSPSARRPLLGVRSTGNDSNISTCNSDSETAMSACIVAVSFPTRLMAEPAKGRVILNDLPDAMLSGKAETARTKRGDRCSLTHHEIKRSGRIFEKSNKMTSERFAFLGTFFGMKSFPLKEERGKSFCLSTFGPLDSCPHSPLVFNTSDYTPFLLTSSRQ